MELSRIDFDHYCREGKGKFEKIAYSFRVIPSPGDNLLDTIKKEFSRLEKIVDGIYLPAFTKKEEMDHDSQFIQVGYRYTPQDQWPVGTALWLKYRIRINPALIEDPTVSLNMGDADEQRLLKLYDAILESPAIVSMNAESLAAQERITLLREKVFGEDLLRRLL